MKGLTITHDSSVDPKVDIYCFNFLKCFERTQAFKETFPNKKIKDYNKAASIFHNKPEVKRRLHEIAGELLDTAKSDVLAIIEETKRIAAFNPMDIMRIDERGHPVLDLTDAQSDPKIMRQMNIEFSNGFDKDGAEHHLYKLKPHDKMDALEKLYKYHKLYQATGAETQPRNISVNVRFPLPGDHWRTGKPVPKEIVDILDSGSLESNTD